MKLFRRQRTPRLSIILIVYDMPRQAMNTLYSLSATYQWGVERQDYEILVVENNSAHTLDESQFNSINANIRYFLREESLPSPVNAINFAASEAKGEQLCIMVDGARMVSPGLVFYLMKAHALYVEAVIATPGYHLGEELQQHAVSKGYDETREQELLSSIDWRNNGYALFEISCLSGTSQSGFFLPIGETNTLGLSKAVFNRLGGFDTGFTDTGGGQCNLDFYKRMVELPETTLVLLPGEGSFHQYHGGVTTGRDTGEERERMMQRHFDQYKSLRGAYYEPPMKEAVLLGHIPRAAMKFVHHSAQAARRSRGELHEPETRE